MEYLKTWDISYSSINQDLMGDIELMLQLPVVTPEVENFLAGYYDENIEEYRNSKNPVPTLSLDPDFLERLDV